MDLTIPPGYETYYVTSIDPLLPRFNHFNPLNAKLNPICHLLTLLGAHPILHVSRVRVNKMNARRQVGSSSFRSPPVTSSF